jgi:hypothetical protein
MDLELERTSENIPSGLRRKESQKRVDEAALVFLDKYLKGASPSPAGAGSRRLLEPARAPGTPIYMHPN